MPAAITTCIIDAHLDVSAVSGKLQSESCRCRSSQHLAADLLFARGGTTVACILAQEQANIDSLIQR